MADFLFEVEDVIRKMIDKRLSDNVILVTENGNIYIDIKNLGKYSEYYHLPQVVKQYQSNYVIAYEFEGNMHKIIISSKKGGAH